MCQTVSIVSGNGLLPFQHQAISSVPEPCWLKINWTLRNNPVKFISPCYLIHLFITVHKIWIELELKENELNWNWIERFWIWFESELNWIEKSWIQLKLELNWIERNELIQALILIESADPIGAQLWVSDRCIGLSLYLPERTWGRPWGWGSEFVPLKKREVGSFILLHKISRTACCFGIRIFLKQYNCYESATIWYTDHEYLAQYSEIINNLQEIPLIFCHYAVRSCGTGRKGPGQSPCNVLSISDLELYVTETSTGVCDPVTD